MAIGLGLCPERCLKNLSVKDQEHGAWQSSVFPCPLLKPINVGRDGHQSLPPLASQRPASCRPTTISHFSLSRNYTENFISFLDWSMNTSQMPSEWWYSCFTSTVHLILKKEWWRCWCQGLNKIHVFSHQQNIGFWTFFWGYALGDRSGHELSSKRKDSENSLQIHNLGLQYCC